MELHKAIKKIVDQFGKDILSERKFINILLDYYQFNDVPARKRIIISLIEDGQLKRLINCCDVMFEINDIVNYEYQINGFQADLTKDILLEFAKGLGKNVESPHSDKVKEELITLQHAHNVSTIDIINAIGVSELISEKYPSNSILTSKLIEDPTVSKGDTCFQNGDYEKAFKLYDSKRGTTSAHLRLAFCYLWGIGTQVDYNKAEDFFMMFAKHGDSISSFGMGLLYERRHMNASDYLESVKWYMKSAEGNYSPALTNLGICYFNGKGVSVDYKEAVKWFKKAVKLKNDYAQAFLGICYLNGYGVRKNISEAVQLLILSSDQGNMLGEYFLGYCYERGIGISQSKEDALRYYMASAIQGYEEAGKRFDALK